jgi:hypothetical protein
LLGRPTEWRAVLDSNTVTIPFGPSRARYDDATAIRFKVLFYCGF